VPMWESLADEEMLSHIRSALVGTGTAPAWHHLGQDRGSSRDHPPVGVGAVLRRGVGVPGRTEPGLPYQGIGGP
jgi:hypothetical protein